MRLLTALLVVALAGCNAPAREPPPFRPPVTQLATHSYPISETEHIVIIDIPDRYVPRRCMVYANEATHTSNISCNFDSAGEPMPDTEGE